MNTLKYFMKAIHILKVAQTGQILMGNRDSYYEDYDKIAKLHDMRSSKSDYIFQLL